MSEQAQIHPPRDTVRPAPKRRNWAQIILAAAVVVTFCYFAEWELAVLIISILIAFILAPVVDLLQRLRLPRGAASLVAVLLLLAALYAITYFSYNETMSFIDNLPKYSSKIRAILVHVRQGAERLRKTTESVLEPGNEEKPAQARPSSIWTDVLAHGIGSFSQAILPLSFIPFLVYFMLTWEHHVRSATVMLFSMENRHAAYTTLGLISEMIRSFLVGNFLVGCFIAAISTAVFGLVGLPSFYVVGVVSGFLSLIPYLGVLLALIVPLVVGLGQLGPTELIIIVATVVTLHLVGINVLYPKFLGSRLQLNPLAVTIALLFWGRLWGAIGLVLAIPITGAMKIIFDHIESLQAYGTWLGE
ncbi:MAG TPA: AI-2E family transporter [Terriglobales bacterium]|nr:AI-2E family transporter [Terriglobales bacterium]